jgi:hypothetical protein
MSVLVIDKAKDAVKAPPVMNPGGELQEKAGLAPARFRQKRRR